MCLCVLSYIDTKYGLARGFKCTLKCNPFKSNAAWETSYSSEDFNMQLGFFFLSTYLAHKLACLLTIFVCSMGIK